MKFIDAFKLYEQGIKVRHTNWDHKYFASKDGWKIGAAQITKSEMESDEWEIFEARDYSKPGSCTISGDSICNMRSRAESVANEMDDPSKLNGSFRYDSEKKRWIADLKW